MSGKPEKRSWWAISETILPWAGIAIAFAAVWYQHLDSKELVRVQVSIEMIKLFDSTEMRQARRILANELLEVLDKKKAPSEISETRLLDFFETLATYGEQQRIDDDSVYSNFSYYIERYWVASKPYVIAFRKEEDDDSLYGSFEDLAESLLKQEVKDRRKPMDHVTPTTEKIRAFLRSEANLLPLLAVT